MKNHFSRRKFLISTAGLLVISSSVGLWSAWKNSKETDVIKAILKRRLGKLNIDPVHFQTFSEEMILEREGYSRQLRMLGIFSGILSVATPYKFLPMGHPFRRLENYAVSNFLLSTDFFQHNADITREINYLGFYNPYKRPCTAFFSSQT